ncbi:MAG: hypothetical protein JW982_04675 [Spirochaetes bacterium]|nr:hypothetical protein [Spirochaetota bacterium]
MSLDLIGILILFAAVILSRMISERANRYISNDEKIKFVDSFSNIRKYSLIPLAIILVLFFITYRYLQKYQAVMLVIYFSLLISYVVILNLWIYFRLKKIEINRMYLRQYLISRAIPLVGIIIFAVLLAVKTLGI